MNLNFIHLLEGFQSWQNRIIILWGPFLKWGRILVVCFYVTALSLNTVETDVLEVLHFYDRKTPFLPILLFGFSTLKPFLLGLTKKQITVHNQNVPTFLSLFSGVPLHTTTQPLLILRGPSEVRKKGVHAYVLNFRRISFVLEKPSYQKIKSNKAFSIQPLNHTPRKESVRQAFGEICGLSIEVQKSFQFVSGCLQII